MTARFQSPPREERIKHDVPGWDNGDVSSHLPARGGSKLVGFCIILLSFPVTSPRGEDLGRVPPSNVKNPVSSHLPARGGSGRAGNARASKRRFQSPPREGRIKCWRRDMVTISWFPVTSPRGEDPPALSCTGWRHCFQSPPREGRIVGLGPPVPVVMPVSSHLPARGGSGTGGYTTENQGCFQSPPREGRILDKAGGIPV